MRGYTAAHLRQISAQRVLAMDAQRMAAHAEAGDYIAYRDGLRGAAPQAGSDGEQRRALAAFGLPADLQPGDGLPGR